MGPSYGFKTPKKIGTSWHAKSTFMIKEKLEY